MTLGESIALMTDIVRTFEDHAKFFFEETLKGCVDLDAALLQDEILALLKTFDQDRLRNLVIVVEKSVKSRTLITKFLCCLFSLQFGQLCADALQMLKADAKDVEFAVLSPPKLFDLEKRPLDELSSTITDMDRNLPNLQAFLQRHRCEIEELDGLMENFSTTTAYLEDCLIS